MKRAERRHLKENEFVDLFAGVVDYYNEHKREVTAGVVALVLLIGGVGGYTAWQRHVQSEAGALLSDAMAVTEARIGAPPDSSSPDAGTWYPTERARAQAALTKYKLAADSYPNTDAGLLARYLEASTRMSLGLPQEAATAYQQVIDKAGDSLYGRMAKLGLAEAEVQTGKVDDAIATFKTLSQQKDGSMPTDAILMQLARAYEVGGKKAEAQQTLTEIVQQYPDSPFTAEAQHDLEVLKAGAA
jgi:predicted negative regulator of RcsB-dependent stress response